MKRGRERWKGVGRFYLKAGRENALQDSVSSTLSVGGRKSAGFREEHINS